MDLSSSRISDEEKLGLCKRYFFAGFLCLPFMWFVNAIWFSKQAFVRNPFPQQHQIRTYVIMSGIGSLVWFVALLSWLIIYIQRRQEWGEFGDRISFNIPLGAS